MKNCIFYQKVLKISDLQSQFKQTVSRMGKIAPNQLHFNDNYHIQERHAFR